MSDVDTLRAERDRDRAWFDGRLRALAKAHGYDWIPGLDLEVIATRLRARITNLEVGLELASRRCHNAFHDGEWTDCRTQACEEAREILARR